MTSFWPNIFDKNLYREIVRSVYSPSFYSTVESLPYSVVAKYLARITLLASVVPFLVGTALLSSSIHLTNSAEIVSFLVAEVSLLLTTFLTVIVTSWLFVYGFSLLAWSVSRLCRGSKTFESIHKAVMFAATPSILLGGWLNVLIFIIPTSIILLLNLRRTAI